MTGVEVGTEYEAGAKVTLTFAAGASLFFGFSASYAKDIYVYVNDNLYHPTFNEVTSKMSLTFEMPEVDVDLQYCYMTSNTAGLTWSFNNLGDYSVRGIDLSKAYTSAISLYLVGPENKQITSLKYETDTGDKGDLDLTTCIDIGGGVYYLKDLSVYSEGATAVTVSLATADAAEHTITYTGLDETKVDVAKSVLPTKGYEGKQTTITVKAAEGYTLAGLKFTGVEATAQSGTATFTMPSGNVTVDVYFVSPISSSDVTVSYVGDSTPSCVTDFGFYQYSSTTYSYVKVDSIEQGKTYPFRVQLNSADYAVTGVKINGVAVSSVTSALGALNCYQASVTIPVDATSIAMEITISSSYTVTFSGNEDLTNLYVYDSSNNMIISGNKAFAGRTISITSACVYGAGYNYIWYSVTVLDGEGVDISEEVGLAEDASHVYSFVMPEKNVTLKFAAPSTGA